MSDYAYAPQPHQPQGPVIAAKDNMIAYLLWFFLGTFGIHKFYLRQPGIGVLYAALNIIGWATVVIVIGWFILIPLWILMIIDLFTMPERIRRINSGQI